MDGWPRSWKSLAWFALAAEAVHWLWDKTVKKYEDRGKYQP